MNIIPKVCVEQCNGLDMQPWKVVVYK